MARVRVTDPFSGATVSVEEDSPQAKAWGVSPVPVVEQEPSSEAGPEKRKPGRPRKTEE